MNDDRRQGVALLQGALAGLALRNTGTIIGKVSMPKDEAGVYRPYFLIHQPSGTYRVTITPDDENEEGMLEI